MTTDIGSHWDECWRDHHECAIAEVERLKEYRRVLVDQCERYEKRVAKLESEAELHEDVTAEYAAKCSMLETANKQIAELEVVITRLEDHEHIPGFIAEYQALNDENDVLGMENEQLKQRIAELEAKASPRTAMERRIYERLLPAFFSSQNCKPITYWELAGSALNAAKRATQVWIDSEHERAERARRDENTDTQGDTIKVARLKEEEEK